VPLAATFLTAPSRATVNFPPPEDVATIVDETRPPEASS
jgi:hypothetical protein